MLSSSYLGNTLNNDQMVIHFTGLDNTIGRLDIHLTLEWLIQNHETEIING